MCDSNKQQKGKGRVEYNTNISIKNNNIANKFREKRRRLVYCLDYKMTHLHMHVTRHNFATC